MSKSFTMYQLMDRAENKPFGSGEIKAYDEAIYQTRVALGITDYYLAEMLCVTERTLLNYDKEPQRITLEKIQLFIDATNVTINELIIK